MMHILIVNRSLFPVHVGAVSFEIDGEVFQMERPYFQAKNKRGRDAPYVDQDSDDLREIQSGDAMRVSIFSPTDRATIAKALTTAAKKYSMSEGALVQSPTVIAMVALQTGKVFNSMLLRQKIWRRALQIKREMDGFPPDVTDPSE
jgi:hypothetical protein